MGYWWGGVGGGVVTLLVTACVIRVRSGWVGHSLRSGVVITTSLPVLVGRGWGRSLPLWGGVVTHSLSLTLYGVGGVGVWVVYGWCMTTRTLPVAPASLFRFASPLASLHLSSCLTCRLRVCAHLPTFHASPASLRYGVGILACLSPSDYGGHYDYTL